jgi:phage gp29-like protein
MPKAKTITRPVIRPEARDFTAHFSGRDYSPAAVGGALDAGARGDFTLQHDLFNTMEDTWPRLRANLHKIKHAVRKLPFNVQPFSPKGGAPSASAQEKAAFVESALWLDAGAPARGNQAFLDATFELMDAVARGFAVVEIDWKVDAQGYLVPAGYRRVPVRYLALDPAGELALKLSGAPFASAASDLHGFADYPGKFLVGVFRSKSGPLGEGAQLRALAPLWLGHMLGWEWLLQKTELFGSPIRWATYPTGATQAEIDTLVSMLRNMGTAAWGAFPQGTQLQLQQGTIPGVAGPSEPSERLMALANRACDLLFLGQNLTSEQSGQGARAAAQVHREVELDLYENYAAFLVDIINDQLIPNLIELNWGSRDELPFVEVEIPRPNRDQEKADRDKLLFGDLGLPVSLQYLYERHRVPAPAATDVLFRPYDGARQRGDGHAGGVAPEPANAGEGAASTGCPQCGRAEPQRHKVPAPAKGDALFQRPKPVAVATPPAASAKAAPCACGCDAPIDAASESAAELAARQQAAASALPGQIAAAEAAGEYLVWESVLDNRTTSACSARHGRRYGDGWFNPPPIHYNCRSTLIRVRKDQYKEPVTEPDRSGSTE